MTKFIALCIVTSTIFLAASTGSASCKPDRTWVDNISKQKNVQWQHNLTEIGFWKSMVASDIEVWTIVARLGNVNVINLQLTKIENDRDRASLDSRFRATKGDRFLFSLKNAAPLSFIAAEVDNQANIVDGKGLVMMAILSAHISDKDMASLKETLSSKRIDAVRAMLASGQVDRTVDEDNGEAMMEKFACFYQYLDRNKISLAGSASETQTATVTDPGAAAVNGRYLRKGKSSDFVELSNGAFSVFQDGHQLSGTYTIQGDVLVLSSPSLRVPAKGRLVGQTILDEEGLTWEKQDERMKDVVHLTVEQIVQMSAAKLADDIIIATIRNSRSSFDLSPEALIKLKTAGVSDAVIRAMTR